jgi:GNAT superfamily N-acetyltransferase
MSPLRGLPGRPAYPFIEQEYEGQLEMVRPSTAPVGVPPVPQGYLLRQFRAGDERKYDDLFHLAFADEGRFPEALERALDGGFFVIEHGRSGELVSSCLAWRGSTMPRHPDAGQMGWLVTDPSHTGKGLGTIVAASATNRLAAGGYQRPCLGTEDFRIAAISIYLKLRWRPYVYREDMMLRWRSILARLGREFDPSTVCPE